MPFSVCLRACEGAGRWGMVLSGLLDMWDRGFHVDSLAYNVGLKAVLAVDDWARVLTTFDDMVCRGAAPVAMDSSCSTALVAAQAGPGVAWQLVVNFLAGMRRGEVDPGTAGYNTALAACIRAGEWERAIGLFCDMERWRVAPDVFTFSSLISGVKAGAWPEKALDLFGDLRGRRLAADSVLVNAAISAASTGEAGLILLHDMLEEELRPDLFTYSSVLDTLAADARWSDAVDLVEDLRFRGLYPSNAVASTLLPKAPWAAALQLWAEAKRGLEPDQVLCGAHLASWEEGYHWQQALGSMRWMQTGHLDLTDVAFSSGILVCANARRWPEAAILLEHMENSSMKPAASNYESANRRIIVYNQGLSATAAQSLSEPKTASAAARMTSIADSVELRRSDRQLLLAEDGQP
ncbi:unnamed protein product [Symbiodinium natans]|uniref:Pentatricopeptide repeat-containing protein n=1 Tax=Symbiodinium natans TaxID=878477 RepID=A0A812U7P2_9DINO|nr:unnamed protein product [Symbiodinium natans]